MFVEAMVRMTNKRKFLFDLDGTITCKELLPEIAREVGLYEAVEELTRETMLGKIPFHESFLHRVDLFRQVPIDRVKAIVADVQLSSGIVSFMREYADRCLIVTGNLDVWVEDLCQRIGVQYHCSSALQSGGYVVGVRSVLNKGDLARSLECDFVAIGEGHNDAEMIGLAEIGIAYGGVHEPSHTVLEQATHAIYDEEKLCQFLKQLL